MEYRYHYTREYLPTRYEASNKDWENSYAVWNFKDGKCSSSVLDELVGIINRIVDGREQEFVICFIPASTKAKNQTRYTALSGRLTERTGVETSMSAITKTTDTESSYIAGKEEDPTKDFCFDSSVFRGKKVILIDDVITRGCTFACTAKKLLSRGATSVEGVFVAKTINPDHCSMVA
jgi:predicted amidophosphoribosyltransferase